MIAPPAGHPDAYLFLWNDSKERLFSHFGTYSWTQQSTVGMTAHLYDSSIAGNTNLARGQRPSVLTTPTVISAKIDMYKPDGNEVVMDMHDDGQSFDLLANDKVYGGKFVADEIGVYRLTTLFEGTLEDGTPFMRSAEHAMVSVPDVVRFPNNASTFRAVADAHSAASALDQMSIAIPVIGTEGKLIRAYAEVYGTVAGTATQKAACWIGGYAKVSGGAVTFELNKRWLVSAGVGAPLTLKRVTLYDGDLHVPLANAAAIGVSFGNVKNLVVKNSNESVLNLAHTAFVSVPTEEMRKGVRPSHLYPEFAAKLRANSNATLPSLVLLHGYCAKDNPWTRNNPVEFTDYAAYQDLSKSRLTNTYAEMVANAYDHLPSFGLVGHSQGGMASAHLRNYMWTGNDAVQRKSGSAIGSRPVQSMGSPYLGVSGAGAALDLGALFGVGCGENFDLTTDGANLWLVFCILGCCFFVCLVYMLSHSGMLESMLILALMCSTTPHTIRSSCLGIAILQPIWFLKSQMMALQNTTW
jgi:hypothetical protein